MLSRGVVCAMDVCRALLPQVRMALTMPTWDLYGTDPTYKDGAQRQVSDCLFCQAARAKLFRTSRAFALSRVRSL